MSLEGIHSSNNNPNISSVNSVDYYVHADLSVDVKINQMIHIGRFATQADATKAVNGILVRCGARDTAGRLAALLADGKIITHTL